MSIQREKFSSQADYKILQDFRELAAKEGRQFQALLEEAMRDLIERKVRNTPRDNVMAHFSASMERNRRLGELLAK